MSIGAEFDSVLTAAQAGGEWAFAALYRDLNPRLLRYFGAQSSSMAEDLAAERAMVAAATAALQAGPTIQPAPSRRKSRLGKALTAKVVAVAATVVLGATAALSAQQASAAIVACLPPDQADVVLLRLVAGLDVDQVARILGKQQGTVRVLQHRALRRLGEIFSQEALTG